MLGRILSVLSLALFVLPVSGQTNQTIAAYWQFNNYVGLPAQISRVTIKGIPPYPSYGGNTQVPETMVFVPSLNPSVTNGYILTNILAGALLQVTFSGPNISPTGTLVKTNFFPLGLTNATGPFNAVTYDVAAVQVFNNVLTGVYYSGTNFLNPTASTNASLVNGVAGAVTIRGSAVQTNSPGLYTIDAPTNLTTVNGLSNNVGIIQLVIQTNAFTSPVLTTNGQTLTFTSYRNTNAAQQSDIAAASNSLAAFSGTLSTNATNYAASQSAAAQAAAIAQAGVLSTNGTNYAAAQALAAQAAAIAQAGVLSTNATNRIVSATNTIDAGSLTGTIALARLPFQANTNNYIGGTGVTLTTNGGTVTIDSTGGGGGSTNAIGLIKTNNVTLGTGLSSLNMVQGGAVSMASSTSNNGAATVTISADTNTAYLAGSNLTYTAANSLTNGVTAATNTIDAASLIGTVADGRLSGNVPLLNAANIWTGGQQTMDSLKLPSSGTGAALSGIAFGFGRSIVVAPLPNTNNYIAGTSITLTTNAGNGTVTIDSSGGGGGATNAIGTVKSGTTTIVTSATALAFSNSPSITATVTSNATGQAVISAALSTNLGSAAFSAATAFDAAGQASNGVRLVGAHLIAVSNFWADVPSYNKSGLGYTSEVIRTNGIHMIFFGDSTGDFLHTPMKNWLLAHTTNGVSESNPFALFDGSNYVQNVVTYTDPAYYWAASGSMKIGSGTNANSPGNFNGNQIELFYYSSSSNGVATIAVSRDNSVWTNIATVDETGGTTEGRLIYTNWAVPQSNWYFRIVATSGTFRLPAAGWGITDTNSKAARLCTMNGSGQTLAQWLAPGTNIATLISNTSPTVIIYQQTKPISGYSDYTNFAAYVTNKSYCLADIILGAAETDDTAVGDTPFSATNAVFIRNVAISNNWTFYNNYIPLSDWVRLTYLIANLDNIHLNTTNGYAWAFQIFCQEIGLSELFRSQNVVEPYVPLFGSASVGLTLNGAVSIFPSNSAFGDFFQSIIVAQPHEMGIVMGRDTANDIPLTFDSNIRATKIKGDFIFIQPKIANAGYVHWFYSTGGVGFGSDGSGHTTADPGSNNVAIRNNLYVSNSVSSSNIVLSVSLTNAATGAGMANGKIYGDGSGETNLNGSSVALGTIPYQRLSATTPSAGYLLVWDSVAAVWTNSVNVNVANLTVNGTNNITNNLPTATTTTKGAVLPDGNSGHFLNGLGGWTAPGGGGSQTPWTSLIDGAGFGLLGAGFVGATNGITNTTTTATPGDILETNTDTTAFARLTSGGNVRASGTNFAQYAYVSNSIHASAGTNDAGTGWDAAGLLTTPSVLATTGIIVSNNATPSLLVATTDTTNALTQSAITLIRQGNTNFSANVNGVIVRGNLRWENNGTSNQTATAMVGIGPDGKSLVTNAVPSGGGSAFQTNVITLAYTGTNVQGNATNAAPSVPITFDLAVTNAFELFSATNAANGQRVLYRFMNASGSNFVVTFDTSAYMFADSLNSNNIVLGTNANSDNHLSATWNTTFSKWEVNGFISNIH